MASFDWHLVLNARDAARGRVSRLEEFADRIEKNPESEERDFVLAVALTGVAICHELRALGMLLNYKRVDAQ